MGLTYLPIGVVEKGPMGPHLFQSHWGGLGTPFPSFWRLFPTILQVVPFDLLRSDTRDLMEVNGAVGVFSGTGMYSWCHVERIPSIWKMVLHLGHPIH